MKEERDIGLESKENENTGCIKESIMMKKPGEENQRKYRLFLFLTLMFLRSENVSFKQKTMGLPFHR